MDAMLHYCVRHCQAMVETRGFLQELSESMFPGQSQFARPQRESDSDPQVGVPGVAEESECSSEDSI